MAVVQATTDIKTQDPMQSLWRDAVNAARVELEEAQEPFDAATKALGAEKDALQTKIAAIKHAWGKKYPVLDFDAEPQKIRTDLQQLADLISRGYQDLSTLRPDRPPTKLYFDEEGFYDKVRDQRTIPEQLRRAAEELNQFMVRLESASRALLPHKNEHSAAQLVIHDLGEEGPEALNSEIFAAESDLQRLEDAAGANLKEAAQLKQELSAINIASLEVDAVLAGSPEAEKTSRTKLDKAVKRQAELKSLLERSEAAQSELHRRIGIQDEHLAGLRDDRNRLLVAVFQYQMTLEEDEIANLLDVRTGALAKRVDAVNRLRLKIGRLADSGRSQERPLKLEMKLAHPGGLSGLDRIAIGGEFPSSR